MYFCELCLCLTLSLIAQLPLALRLLCLVLPVPLLYVVFRSRLFFLYRRICFPLFHGTG